MTLGGVVAINLVWLLGWVGFRYLAKSRRHRTGRRPSEDLTAARLLELRTWFDEGVITKAEYDTLRANTADPL